ncbi:MAG: hypothetical protein WBW61_03595 [Rhodanobacteraceae bacterium]
MPDPTYGSVCGFFQADHLPERLRAIASQTGVLRVDASTPPLLDVARHVARRVFPSNPELKGPGLSTTPLGKGFVVQEGLVVQ